MKLLDFFIDVSIRGGNAIAQLSQIESRGDGAERGLNRMSAGAVKAAKKLAATALAGFTLIKSMKAVIRTGAEWETAMAGVAKTTDLTDAELAKFKSNIKKLARNPEVGATAVELMELAETAGTLGIKGVDNLTLFSESMAKLGSASGGKLVGEEAAQAIVNIINASGEDASNVDNLASSIASLGNSAAANEAQIVSASTNIAKSLRRFRPASHQVVALGTAFAEMKISPELAGTAISKTLNQIEKSLAKGGKKMDEFKAITGLTEKQIREMLKTDAAGLFAKFAEGLNTAQKSGKSLTTVLDKLGLDDIRTGDTLKSIATEAGRMNEVLEQSKREFKNLGEAENALDKEAQRAGDTYAKKKQAMQESVKGLADTIANAGILDLLKGMFDGMNNLIAGVDSLIQTLAPFVDALDPMAVMITLLIALLPTLATAIVTSLIPAISAAILAVWSFTAALLANPIVWIIVGIYALVRAVMWLWKNWGDIGNKIVKLTDKLFGPAAAQFVGRYIQAIKNLFSGLFQHLKLMLSFFKALFTGDFKGAWEVAKDIVRNAVDSITGAFSTLFPNAAAAFKAVYTSAKEWLFDKLGGVFNWAGDKLRAIGGWFKGLFTDTDKEVEAARAKAEQEAIQISGGVIPPVSASAPAVVGVRPNHSTSSTTIDARQDVTIKIDGSKDPRATGREVRKELGRIERGARLDATA